MAAAPIILKLSQHRLHFSAGTPAPGIIIPHKERTFGHRDILMFQYVEEVFHDFSAGISEGFPIDEEGMLGLENGFRKSGCGQFWGSLGNPDGI